MADYSFLTNLAKTLLSLFINKETEKNGKIKATEANITIHFDGPKEKTTDESEIDWTNPECMISKYFSVKEALWLPSWQVMHTPSESEKTNIAKQAAKMDLIRDFLGVPINVHCWIRPILNNPSSLRHGQDYNAFVKGAKNSSHKVGLATDYDAKGLDCDDVRERLVPKLDIWEIRMEKMPKSNWVHNDSAEVVVNRYFNP